MADDANKDQPQQGDDASLSPDELEALFAQAQGEARATPAELATPAEPVAVTEPAEPVASASGDSDAQGDIDLLLNQAEQALASVTSEMDAPPAGVKTFEFEDFSGTPASSEAATLDLVRDVELDVKIELGRTNMHLQELLKLRKGSVVPLDKLAGDPVDIYVNGRLVARGEVLVLNDNFCIRIAELIASESAVA